MPGNETKLVPGSFQKATATAEQTTSSGTDVLVDSMSITPDAGTYAVWFTGIGTNSTKGNGSIFSVYVGGVREDASESVIEPGGNDYKGSFRCTAVVFVDGAQAIEGRFKAGATTAKVYARTLLISKVA
jgi:hypothetical protein